MYADVDSEPVSPIQILLLHEKPCQSLSDIIVKLKPQGAFHKNNSPVIEMRNGRIPEKNQSQLNVLLVAVF